MAERAGKEAHGMEITILDSLEHLRTRAGAALPGQHGRRHACLPLPDGSYYISFLHYDAGKGLEQRLEILCTRGGLFLAGDRARLKETLEDLPPQAREEPFLALAWFLYLLLENDFDNLERLEGAINELELGIIQAAKPLRRASDRIASLRRTLLRTKRYYDHLGLAADRLAENESGSIPKPALARLILLQRRLSYLRQTPRAQPEYVTQVREASQAQLDIQQNQVMKLLTLLTAVFMPLTLVAGWYGMNFNMPELSWPLGYAYVIALSALVCALCFWIFKKKKWF